MQLKSIAKCSKGSILQYFRPALSYHMALRPLFRLFLSGRLRPVSQCGLYFRFPGAAGGGQGSNQGGNEGGQYDEGDDDLYS